MKSRDMHWALVAHKDQKDINLSSLRMLLVADGSNPCKVTLSRARSLQRGVLERENGGEMEELSWEVRKPGRVTGVERDVQ